MAVKPKKHGFTLTELIIVIAILAILAAILVPLMVGYIEESQTSVCQTNMATVRRLYTYEAGLASGDLSDTGKLLSDALAKTKETYVDATHYKGSCGGTVTVVYTDGLISSMSCDRHGEAQEESALTPGGGLKYNANLKNPGDTLKTVADGLTNFGNRVDSTAPDTNAAGADSRRFLLVAALKNSDIDLASSNIVTWAVVKEGSTKVVWLSDVALSDDTLGKSVRVIRYNPNRGTYTAGYMKVQKSVDIEDADYNQFVGGGTDADRWTEYTGQTDDSRSSYEKTLAVFNTMPLYQ